MIIVDNEKKCVAVVQFAYEDALEAVKLPELAKASFNGTFLASVNLFSQEILTVVVGLGKLKEVTLAKVKEAASKAAKIMKELKQKEYAVDALAVVREYGVDSIYDLVAGINLSLYEFEGYYSKPEEKYTFTAYLQGFCSTHKEELQEQADRAQTLADSILRARDWVNMPGNMLTPNIMAEKIAQAGKDAGCEAEIIEEDQAAKMGMNCFLAVGKSSSNRAKLVVLRYRGAPENKEITALIGKGVTCDTGGYSLKNNAGLENTKGDMGGAAAVTGAICALAKNKVKANVIAVVPACENRLSNEAVIPGDVVTSMNGKTVEILNSDAEGRLILADAMTYAIRKEKATRLVDVATLTGAIHAALGNITAGLMTNNTEFSDEFMRASKKAGEKYWQLPTDQEYKKMLKGRVADLVNTARFGCGAVVAGLFVGEFCEDLPWIHLDIAGTAWVKTPDYEYQTKGATGAAVSSLYFLLGSIAI